MKEILLLPTSLRVRRLTNSKRIALGYTNFGRQRREEAKKVVRRTSFGSVFDFFSGLEYTESTGRTITDNDDWLKRNLDC